MNVFGSSFGAPNVCPHCRSQVDTTRYGTLPAHINRATGSWCSGAGLPPSPVPPWPGTVRSPRAGRSERKFSLRRRTRRSDADRLPTAS